MDGFIRSKAVLRSRGNIDGTPSVSLKAEAVAGFKKFDPYAFLERERRLVTTNGTTQNRDGNLVKPNFSWFSTLAASAPGIEKGAGSSDLPSLQIDIQNQNSDAVRAKVLKPLKFSNLIPTIVVDAFAVLERRCPDYIESRALASGR
jgi:hypothetical protein